METENLYGHTIQLIINHYNNNDNDKNNGSRTRTERCAEIILNTSTTTKHNIKYKAIITCIIAALNFIIFHFSLSNPSLFLFIFILISYVVFQLMFKVKTEKLLIIKSLGIQFTIEYYTGSSRIQFIPWSDLNKVFINEILTQQKVLYVLTITTKDKTTETIIPLFQNIKPRLKCLEKIYKEVENIML